MGVFVNNWLINSKKLRQIINVQKSDFYINYVKNFSRQKNLNMWTIAHFQVLN